MRRNRLLFLVLWFCAAPGALAQDGTMPADSTVTDTVIVRMMHGMGDAFPGRPAEVFVDSQWQWTDVRTLPEALTFIPGVYAFEAGEEGKPVEVWYLGAPARSEPITIDGTPIGSPLFPSSAYTMFPLEFVQGIEELRGPAAVFLNARWNLRTHQYASPEPRTAIRFVQSPFETIFTDGLYTQNVARSTNLAFGFQRRASDGRFENAALDSWALRGRIRYNATPRLNLMGSWAYEKTSNGMNGGIDRTRTTTLFEEVNAVVLEPQAYELRTSTTTSLHAVADILKDSLSLTRLTMTRIDEEREFNRSVPSLNRPARQEFAITNATQIRLEQAVSLPFVLMRGMGELRTETATDSTILRGVDRTAKAAGVTMEVLITPIAVPSFGVRVDKGPDGSRTSIGAALDLRPFAGLTLTASYEQRTLFPGLFESAWRDTLVLQPTERRIGQERFPSVRLVWEFMHGSHITIEAFRREQTDRSFYSKDTLASGQPYLTGSYEDIKITGGQISGRLLLEPFYLSGWLTMLRVDGPARVKELLPAIWASWEVGWKDRFFDEKLGLQATLRGSFYDRHRGFAPDPLSGLQVLQTDIQVGRMTRLDGFLVLDIGDAFVTLAWENIVNSSYYKMATFPMPERTFRFGVRWRFLD